MTTMSMLRTQTHPFCSISHHVTVVGYLVVVLHPVDRYSHLKATTWVSQRSHQFTANRPISVTYLT